jgi:hypothetical protein
MSSFADRGDQLPTLCRVSGVIPVAEIFDKNIEKIKCWAQAYIECGTERLELTQAYFIENA